MAPIESFFPKDVNFSRELSPAVKKVLSARNILMRNDNEDEQTHEEYIVYAIGKGISSAEAFVLIGNDSSKSDSISDVGKKIRPHLLIGSADIIEDVKAEISNMRSSPTTAA